MDAFMVQVLISSWTGSNQIEISLRYWPHLNWSMCHGLEVTGGTSIWNHKHFQFNQKYPKYLLSDQTCPKGTSCWTRSIPNSLLVRPEVPKATSCLECKWLIEPNLLQSQPFETYEWARLVCSSSRHGWPYHNTSYNLENTNYRAVSPTDS